MPRSGGTSGVRGDELAGGRGVVKGVVARKLALGFATSAQADDQLATLGAWLARKDLTDGLVIDAELRARILFTLAARGLAHGEDIDALPGLDPVTGAANRATGLAMQPDLAAKEAAWAAAVSAGEPARIAQACAAGIWARTPPSQRITSCG